MTQYTISSPPMHKYSTINHHRVCGYLSATLRTMFVCVLLCVFVIFSVFAQAQFAPLQTNDSLASQQYALDRLNIRRAMSVTTGSLNIVIAVISDGCDLRHADLQGAIFVNRGEIPNNGIDDDSNGYIDDVTGWDFVGNTTAREAGLGIYREDADVSSGTPLNGTHCAGIIAARSNNRIGITGIAQGCTILPIKVFSDNPDNANAQRVADALQYAISMGAQVIYCAFARNPLNVVATFSSAEQAWIAEAQKRGIIVIAPMGDQGIVAESVVYPASYNGVIAVGATDQNNSRMVRSNMGAQTTVFASGDNIMSTLPNGRYGTLSGTVQAGAHIAGIMALLRSVYPNTPVPQLVQRLRSTSIIPPDVPSLLRTLPAGSNTTRDPLMYGIADAFSAIIVNNATLSSRTVPALVAMETTPYLLFAPNGTIVSQISGTGDHTLRLRLRNVLGAVNNVQVRLLPTATSNGRTNDAFVLVDSTTTMIPVLPSGIEGGQPIIATVDVRVRLTPRAFLLTNEDQPIAQCYVQCVVGNDAVIIPLSIPIGQTLTARQGLEIAPTVSMGTLLVGESNEVTIPIVNTNATTATVNSIGFANSSTALRIVRQPVLPVRLDPGASTSVTIRFSPQTVGFLQSTLNVVGSVFISGSTTATRTTSSSLIVGRGRDRDIAIDDIVRFPAQSVAVVVGARGESSLRIVNRSTNATFIGTLRADTTTQSGFQFNLPSSLRLAPRDSVVIPVSFTPSTTGLVSMTISVIPQSDMFAVQSLRVSRVGINPSQQTTQANLSIIDRRSVPTGLLPQQEQMIDFDSAPINTVQTQSLLLFNPTRDAIVIRDIQIQGRGAEEFSVSPTTSVSVASGDSLVLSIVYQARTFSEKSVRLVLPNINHTLVSITARGSRTAVLINTPRSAADIRQTSTIATISQMTPNILMIRGATVVTQNITPTRVRTTTRFPIAIGNAFTNATLTIQSLDLIQENAEYRVVSQIARTLQPRVQDTLTMEFTPTSVGQRTVRAVLSYTVGTSQTVSRDTADLAGVGLQAGSQIVTATNQRSDAGRVSSVVYPDTRVTNENPPIDYPFVANIGTDRTVITPRVSGRDAQDFVIIRPFPNFVSQAGASDSIAVLFRPRTVGTKQANLILTTDDGQTLIYSLSGRALLAPTLTASIASVPLGAQISGTNAPVVNLGRVELGDQAVVRVVVRGVSIVEPIIGTIAGNAGYTLRRSSVNAGQTLPLDADDQQRFYDTIDVVLTPSSFDTLRATVRWQTEQLVQSMSLVAIGIPSTRPRITFGSFDRITFDSTLFVGATSTRNVQFTGVSLTEGIRVVMPTRFGLVTAPSSVVFGDTLLVVPNGRSFIDTSITILFAPRVPTRLSDSIVFLSRSGNQTIRSAVPISAFAQYRPGITVASGFTFPRIIARSTITQTIPVILNVLAVGSTRATFVINRGATDGTFSIVDLQGRNTDTLQIVYPLSAPATSAMIISTSISIRFTPPEQGLFTDRLRLFSSNDSLNFDADITLTGTAGPRTDIQSTTRGVEFGTQTIGSIVSRIMTIGLTNMVDTVFVSRAATLSPFSFSIGEAHRSDNFFIVPRPNRSADTTFAILFEPNASNRIIDTLNFVQAGELIYTIIVAGQGSTAVSVRRALQTQNMLMIAPLPASDEVRMTLPASVVPLRIQMTAVDGRRILEKTLSPMNRSYEYVIPIQQYPSGLYTMSVTDGLTTWFASVVIQR